MHPAPIRPVGPDEPLPRRASAGRPVVVRSCARPLACGGADRCRARSRGGSLAGRTSRGLRCVPVRRGGLRRGSARPARTPRHHAGTPARPLGTHGRSHRARIRRTRAIHPRGIRYAAAAWSAFGDRRHRDRPRGHGPVRRAGSCHARMARPRALRPEPPGRERTPMLVAAGSVTWLRRLEDGEIAYNVAALDEVCPVGDQPNCAALSDQAFERLNLQSAPKSVIGSPIDGQAVVVGQDASGRQTIVVVSLPKAAGTTQAPTSTPKPTSTPTPAETATAPVETPAPARACLRRRSPRRRSLRPRRRSRRRPSGRARSRHRAPRPRRRPSQAPP